MQCSCVSVKAEAKCESYRLSKYGVRVQYVEHLLYWGD